MPEWEYCEVSGACGYSYRIEDDRYVREEPFDASVTVNITRYTPDSLNIETVFDEHMQLCASGIIETLQTLFDAQLKRTVARLGHQNWEIVAVQKEVVGTSAIGNYDFWGERFYLKRPI